MTDHLNDGPELDDILHIVIEIGNKLSGQPYIHKDKNFIYAEGLGKKLIGHSLSARHLYSGFQAKIKSNIFAPQIDFSSILILTRAAVESYLTFHYLFVSPRNETERDFRFLCWDLSGYLDRENAEATQKEFIERKEAEKKRIQELKKQIREHDYLKTHGEKIKELALDGQWRLKSSWSKIAVKSGFKKTFFDKQYKFLCGYAHSGRLSVLQIQQTKNNTDEKQMADASLGILKMVLAKYIFDYVNLIPELKSTINFETPDYYKVIVYNKVATTLK